LNFDGVLLSCGRYIGTSFFLKEGGEPAGQQQAHFLLPGSGRSNRLFRHALDKYAADRPFPCEQT